MRDGEKIWREAKEREQDSEEKKRGQGRSGRQRPKPYERRVLPGEGLPAGALLSSADFPKYGPQSTHMPTRVFVNVLQARSLPVMDRSTGLCDAYVKPQLKGVTFEPIQTQVCSFLAALRTLVLYVASRRHFPFLPLVLVSFRA